MTCTYVQTLGRHTITSTYYNILQNDINVCKKKTKKTKNIVQLCLLALLYREVAVRVQSTSSQSERPIVSV